MVDQDPAQAPLFIGIGEALDRNMLKVPRFQRSYAWTEEHVRELFQDLAAAIKDKAKQYFLGSIVTIQTDDGRLEVLDGQQRLATISILISAIVDYMYEKMETKRGAQLQDHYLITDDIRTGKPKQHLVLNSRDNDFFLNRILSDPSSDSRKIQPSLDSHRKLEVAAQIARERVEEIVHDSKEPIDRLIDWIQYIVVNAKVLWFTVSSDANAFMIFETLNDRGLELTVLDLLKNYLFSRAVDRVDEVEEKWMKVVHEFEAYDDQRLMLQYIHQFWSSIYGLTRERELFNAIKRELKSTNEVVNFCEIMVQGARLYMAMLNAEDEYWDPFTSKYPSFEVKQNINALNQLRLYQFRPLLLAVLRKFSQEEIARTIPMLVSWTVRFLIDGAGGGSLESKYPAVAAKVTSGDIATADDLYKEMQPVLRTDREFETTFSVQPIARQYVARYLLGEIEKYMRRKNPELRPDDDPLKVNIEHILPDTYSPLWKEFTEDEHKAYKNRLGNLTLLGSKINSKAKSELFSAKQRDHYSGSEFLLTKELLGYKQWTRNEIETRQKALAAIAVKRWPALPPKKP